MDDFLERLKTEQKELSEKIMKLFTFMSTSKYIALDATNKALLKIQYEAMVTYRECLIQRLKILSNE